MPKKMKVISEDECLKLCNLFYQLWTSAKILLGVPPALAESFVTELPCTVKERTEIVNCWVDIESNENIVLMMLMKL